MSEDSHIRTGPGPNTSCFVSNLADKIIGVYQLGAHRRIMSEVAKVAGMATLSCGLIGRTAVELENALLEWESQNQSITSLRALGDTAFAEKKATLLHILYMGVQTFVATISSTDIVRLAN